MSFKCAAQCNTYFQKLKKIKPCNLSFHVAGSYKTHPTNVLGRASTTLPRLAQARYFMFWEL